MAATGYNGEVWRIALAVPGSEPYDYLPPAVASARFQPGVRVRVPLGGAQRVGVVVERCQGSGLPLDRLKRVGATLEAVHGALVAAHERLPRRGVLLQALGNQFRVG